LSRNYRDEIAERIAAADAGRSSCGELGVIGRRGCTLRWDTQLMDLLLVIGMIA
jgi:hypothetical protein